MRRPISFYVLVLALVLIAILASTLAGGIGKVQSYACKTDAEALNLPWKWTQFGGCKVQTKQGAWVPLNQYRVPQVP